MPVIKVTDIAYGRLRSPDLDQAETFLTDFGLVRTARTATALYMRGTDADHHIHVTELGPPAFLGFAYYAASEADLTAVSKVPGASAVEAIDEPGGGKRVRLRDPHGITIEVVHGIEQLEPLQGRTARPQLRPRKVPAPRTAAFDPGTLARQTHRARRAP